MNLARLRPSVLIAAALTLAAGQAMAVPIPPGGASTLPGTTGPGGSIIRDSLIPFTIRDAGGSVIMRGNVQDRVVRTATGALSFEPRIRDVTGSTAFGISRVTREGLDDFFTDVDWSPSGLGIAAPTFATRSGDGDTLDYAFSFSPVFTGSSSRFFRAVTDADQYSLTGRMTLQLENGLSTTIQVAAPIIDTTPPDVRITAPDPESCVCQTVFNSIEGVICDDESDITSWTIRARRSGDAGGTDWFVIDTGSLEFCTPTTITNWDTTSVPAGEYIIELEARNEVGLVSTAAIEVRVNGGASPASIRTPEDGQIIGGNTCLDGTIGEDCFSNYRVDYRPATGGAFLPVDDTKPVYSSRVINDPFAFWNTRAVLDGDYQVRVRVNDICSDNADVIRTYEVDNTAPVGRITSLTPCEWVNGKVEIKGEIFDKNIASWVLEYTGGSSRGWTRIASGSDNIPAGGVIAEWDTKGLERCAYTVRLRASDRARVGCVAPSGNTTHDMVSVNVGCEADLDGNGVLDIFDFLMFSNIFAAGCP
ncbi:MAG: hypothetical protein ACIAS6_15070 [Phycisphaerales bacterium JB060]